MSPPLVTREVVESYVTGIDGGAPTGPELTTRQREVLQLLAEGHTVKDIAATLKISPRTVEFHNGQDRGTAGSAHDRRARQMRTGSRSHESNSVPSLNPIPLHSVVSPTSPKTSKFLALTPLYYACVFLHFCPSMRHLYYAVTQEYEEETLPSPHSYRRLFAVHVGLFLRFSLSLNMISSRRRPKVKHWC